jgi:hypothetical protein
VPVNPLVPQRAEIAAGVAGLDNAAELRIDREQVLESSVLRAGFPDDHTTILFENRRLDLTVVPLHQIGQITLAVND